MIYALHKLARSYEKMAETRTRLAREYPYGHRQYEIHMTAAYCHQGYANALREMCKAQFPAQTQKLESPYDKTH